MTKADRWKKRRCVVRYFEFRDYVKEVLFQSGYRVGDRLRMDFYVPMPKTWSKKKKAEMNRAPHQQKPDIDNYIKGLLDAVFKDDSKVHEILARKFWSMEPAIVLANRPYGETASTG